MLSQDYDELYITIAEYDQEYIRGRPTPAQAPFHPTNISPTPRPGRATSGASDGQVGYSPMRPTTRSRSERAGGLDAYNANYQQRSNAGFAVPNASAGPSNPRFGGPNTGQGRINFQPGNQMPSNRNQQAPPVSRPKDHLGFLCMKTYGPYNLSKADQVEIFCRYVTALSIQALREESNPDPFYNSTHS